MMPPLPALLRIGPTLLLAACLAACSSAPERRILPDAEIRELQTKDTAQAQEEVAAAIGRVMARIARKLDEHADGTPEPVLDILAMTGGGDYGAFGSGILVGWGRTADAAWRRPDFDVVTGVSTGAMLAPFAYVGTDDACELVDHFYRNPKKDWVQMRSLFFLPSNASFSMIPGLERDIRAAIDKEFVKKMAEQSARGKLMLVSATNLDLGTRRFWPVGAIAAKAVDSEADLEKMNKILLASAAIPVIFPPIEIDGFLYADGGVTANVLLGLDPWNPAGLYQTWARNFPGRPFPKTRYWIIMNNQMRPPPGTVQARWPGIAGPALATAIRSATIAEIRWLTAQANYVNSDLHSDIEVRVVAIPNDWRPPTKGDFQKETMTSLSDLGQKLGADPASWTVWTAKSSTEP